MKRTEQIPFSISEYLQHRFHDDFLCELKAHRSGRYIVEVAKDEYVYTLTFSEHGSLLREEDEPAFPENEHEHEGVEAIL